MKVKFSALVQTNNVRLHAKFRLDQFTLSPSGTDKLQFLPFWTSAFSDVDSWRQFEKVEHGCTTTNLPLSRGVNDHAAKMNVYCCNGKLLVIAVLYSIL